MKPITKLYLKTFLVMGIAYGLSMIGFDLLRGEGFSLSKFLFLTVSFGGTMSLILVSLLRHRLRKMGIQEITDESLNVFQKKNGNYLDAPILRQKIGIFVDVDVGTHGRASLREKILAKTGAKSAFFDQNSPS